MQPQFPLLWPREESEAATPRNSAGVVELTAHYQELTAPSTGYTSPEGNESPDPVVTRGGTTGDGQYIGLFMYMD